MTSSSDPRPMRENTNPQVRPPDLVRLLMRVPVPWVFVLTYLAGVGLQLLLPVHVPKREALRMARLAGMAALAVGAFFAAWSLILFHKAQTTTTPGERSVRLVTWGPYRRSRNPMYVSLILAYLGEAAILTQPWPILLLPLTVAYLHRIVIPIEEGRLREVFAGEYEQYCASVRRWI